MQSWCFCYDKNSLKSKPIVWILKKAHACFPNFILDWIVIMGHKRKNNKNAFSHHGKVFLALFIIGLSGHIYMKHIEPKWIETTNFPSATPYPPSFHDFKIVQFSDTHIGYHLNMEQFEKLLTSYQEKPDLIIFSGDLVDNLLSFFEYEEVMILLGSLSAPYGKYAVYGNR